MTGLTRAQIADALREVVDPELGINVVDLGLLYGVQLCGDLAVLEMTLTSPACPLTDEIEGQVFAVLDGVVADHRIEWVWTPPWSPAAMSDEGKSQARAMGLPL